MKKLSELFDYSGIDKSNEISLYEYGLLCKVIDNNIHCYYGVGSDNDANHYLDDIISCNVNLNEYSEEYIISIQEIKPKNISSNPLLYDKVNELLIK